MEDKDKFCESCIYACPWDYTFERIMCSRTFEEKEPFDNACKCYIPESHADRVKILRGNKHDEEEY